MRCARCGESPEHVKARVWTCKIEIQFTGERCAHTQREAFYLHDGNLSSSITVRSLIN